MSILIYLRLTTGKYYHFILQGFQARGTPITTSLITFDNFDYRHWKEHGESRRRRRRQATQPSSTSTVETSTESPSTITFGITEQGYANEHTSFPQQKVRICVETHPNQNFGKFLDVTIKLQKLTSI